MLDSILKMKVSYSGERLLIQIYPSLSSSFRSAAPPPPPNSRMCIVMTAESRVGCRVTSVTLTHYHKAQQSVQHLCQQNQHPPSLSSPTIQRVLETRHWHVLTQSATLMTSPCPMHESPRCWLAGIMLCGLILFTFPFTEPALCMNTAFISTHTDNRQLADCEEHAEFDINRWLYLFNCWVTKQRMSRNHLSRQQGVSDNPITLGNMTVSTSLFFVQSFTEWSYQVIRGLMMLFCRLLWWRRNITLQ